MPNYSDPNAAQRLDHEDGAIIAMESWQDVWLKSHTLHESRR